MARRQAQLADGVKIEIRAKGPIQAAPILIALEAVSNRMDIQTVMSEEVLILPLRLAKVLYDRAMKD